MQRILWVCTVMVLAYGVSVQVSGSESESSHSNIDTSVAVFKQKIPVHVVTVAQQPVHESRTFTGTTRAVHRAVMRSQISGRVDYLPLKLGQSVRKGQLLAELYNPEAAPAARSARVRWQQLQDQQGQQQRDFERISALYEEGQASRQDFEQARTALNSANDAALGAESEYQRASGLDQERQIRAPFAGVITSISTDVGEVISPGQALLQLADPNTVELEVVVNSQISANLKLGQVVTVNMPLQSGATGGVIATVKEVSPFRDRGALPTVVLGFADVSNSDVNAVVSSVKSGMAISAQFKVPLGEAFVVPSSALVRYGDGAVIYRLTTEAKGESQVEPINVIAGAVQTNGLLVTGALAEGDRIVVTGTQRMFNGAAVQVMP